ncbi:hypothetical protein [Streptomyces sp. NPDC008137]|uniref:hypothetical protein n=1 Tax=Streptomyces sp. NPDC008137 TaxID=3364813 RepID=UPI0036E786F8
MPAHPMPALQRMAGNAAVAQAVAEERREHDAHRGHTPSVQRRALVHAAPSGTPTSTPSSS